MINIFLEKSCAKCGGETIARPSSKNRKLDIFPIDGLKFYTCCFYFMPNWRLFKYIDVKLQTFCFCLILSLKKKKKGGLELFSLSHFLHDFWRKTFILLCFINCPNFIAWLPFLCEILGNTCIAIVYEPGPDVINFEINLIFLIKPIFLNDQKVKTKI